MGDCGVCIGYDGDGEYPEFSEIRTPKAKRVHKCTECDRDILPGERYQYYIGKFDGDFCTEKTCSQCAEIRAAFSCEEWPMFGELWNEIIEFMFPVITTACYDKLSTPEAKAKVRDRWMQWKGLAA